MIERLATETASLSLAFSFNTSSGPTFKDENSLVQITKKKIR